MTGLEPLPPGHVGAVVTYLEMTAPPAVRKAPESPLRLTLGVDRARALPGIVSPGGPRWLGIRGWRGRIRDCWRSRRGPRCGDEGRRRPHDRSLFRTPANVSSFSSPVPSWPGGPWPLAARRDPAPRLAPASSGSGCTPARSIIPPPCPPYLKAASPQSAALRELSRSTPRGLLPRDLVPRCRCSKLSVDPATKATRSDYTVFSTAAPANQDRADAARLRRAGQRDQQDADRLSTTL